MNISIINIVLIHLISFHMFGSKLYHTPVMEKLLHFN